MLDISVDVLDVSSVVQLPSLLLYLLTLNPPDALVVTAFHWHGKNPESWSIEYESFIDGVPIISHFQSFPPCVTHPDAPRVMLL